MAEREMNKARDDFASDRTLLTIVLAFSTVSVLVALLMGFLLSWAFLLPVKKMQRALAAMSAGNLGRQVEVPNRDEFGQLSQDLNSTSQRLETPSSANGCWRSDSRRPMPHWRARAGEVEVPGERQSRART